MADPSPHAPRVKLEASPPPAAVSGTTIGGAVRTTFAPKIPPRRKAGDAAGPAGAAGGGKLSDLITVKEEKKYVPRAARLSSTAAPAAAVRVAFQPSQPGQASAASASSGEVDSRDVSVVVTRAPTTRAPGQEEDKKPRVKSAPAADAGASGEGAAAAGSTESAVEMEDVTDAAEAAEEAELAGMLATESSYDSFLDNGDLVQYRPILLPFPKVRMGVGGAGRASTVQRASVVPSPMGGRPSSSQSNVASMFDIDDEDARAGASAAASAQFLSPPPIAAAAAAPRPRSASPAGASYKMFPPQTPARLLCHIDHEEKAADLRGPGPPPTSQNLLFFQFPSHLPFKQSATWAPPVNPLLSLNGNRQTSLGANTSAISFGATVDIGGTHSGGAISGSGPPNFGARPPPTAGVPSPSLQALQNISSPMLPPMAGLGMGGLPSFSLGQGATPAAAAASAHGVSAASSKARASVGGSGGSSAPSSGLLDSTGTSSALAGDEEQDLGEMAKNDPSKLSEAERMAREHKARQARKLLLYSSNFEHAMRHLPAGHLGSLVIYKSGKLKLRIGDIVLDVNEGVQCLFHQELMSVQAASGEAFRLGAVNHRLVCTNDVEDLVRKTRERAVPQSNARA